MQMRIQKCCDIVNNRRQSTSRKIGDLTVTNNLLKHAARGDVAAQYRLACCYAEGFSVERDEVTACVWFQSAAEKGYVPAMSRLGDCYLNGYGFDQNRIRGHFWLLKAANLGNRDAAALLGTSYLKEQRLPSYPNLAVKWLRIASNLGCLHSMLQLGFCYRQGIGLEQDIVKACVCLNVLEARSRKGVTLELNMEWIDKLTEDQFAEVRRLSETMIKGGKFEL